MAALPCDACHRRPVMRCGRCTTTRCRKHVLPAGQRCERCERDWLDERATRRSAKLIFAPPIGILTGGVLFGLLFPVALGGIVGVALTAALACGSAAGATAGACRVVDRSARSMFLRERAGGLPPMRLLPSPRHR